MDTTKRYHGKRCGYCGKFFKPHSFVGDRQAYCSREKCQRERKRKGQKKWGAENPGYFRGRYGGLKEWRAEHPDYQRQWREKRRAEIQDLARPESPVKSVRLVVPEKLWSGEIQDLALSVRRCGCGSWVAGVPTRDTRRAHEGNEAAVL